MKKFILIFALFLVSKHVFAVIELDAEFGYSKSRFGSNKESKSVSRSYSGSMAFYFLSATAVEFNYKESEDETVVNYDTAKLTGTVITDQYSNLKANRYGVGIRQALAPRKSFLVPMISIGWARQKKTSYSTATILNKTNSETALYNSGKLTDEYDSVFGSFALKLRLTKTMSLKGSVTTYFQAFEWNEAKDQLSYTAGLTWFF